MENTNFTNSFSNAANLDGTTFNRANAPNNKENAMARIDIDRALFGSNAANLDGTTINPGQLMPTTNKEAAMTRIECEFEGKVVPPRADGTGGGFITTHSKESVVVKIKINDIIIPKRRRGFNEKNVSDLMSSISLLGGRVMHMPSINRKYELITGYNRVEALRRLGYEEIEVVVQDYNDVQCELAEIDENLLRYELDWLEMGIQARARDELLKRMGLRAQSGDNQHKKKGAKSKKENAKSEEGTAKIAPPKAKTTAEFAKELGTNERTLLENIQIARDLVPEAIEAVRKMDIPKNLALKISRFTPEEQKKVIEDVTSELSSLEEEGEVKSADRKKVILDVVQAIKPKNPAAPSFKATFTKIQNLLERVDGAADLFITAFQSASAEQKEEVAALWEEASSKFVSVADQLENLDVDYPAEVANEASDTETSQHHGEE